MKKISCFIALIAPLSLLAQLTPQFIQLRPSVAVFRYTASIQSWVVPSGITTIYFDVQGAQGGNKTTAVVGGLGGRVRGKMNVTPGTTLYITVGGQPTSNVAVYGGAAGAGGTNVSNTGTNALAGGGLSAIASGSTLTQGNAYIIAGGGGGASRVQSGGAGGGTAAANGSGVWSTYLCYGRGGTASAGGTFGTTVDNQTIAPAAGSALTGGNGGSINTTAGTWSCGGGGGAGYYGGGGAAGGGSASGSGGGGSSYATTVGLTDVIHNQGFKNGNGAVYIFY